MMQSFHIFLYIICTLIIDSWKKAIANNGVLYQVVLCVWEQFELQLSMPNIVNM